MNDLDQDLMRRALALADNGPAADPNPRVGAVIVDDLGRIVGEGWHRGAGTPHAEAMALQLAGEHAIGGTAYVTLEPCHHTGRTGPCSEALLAAGIARVVYAASDVNPAARGGGDFLRAQGVRVTSGVLAAQAETLNRAWAFAMEHGRPMITWKFASTLDGFSAAADGTSRWITSTEARNDVHHWRERCGAILVGTGTALRDDPHLTVRQPDGTLRRTQPLRVVVGERDLPDSLRIFDDASETLHLSTRDPLEVMHALHHRQIRHVWLEGGPTLAAAMWQAGLIDEVIAYIAPALLGDGRPAISPLGLTSIDDIARLETVDVRPIGGDIRVVARPRTKEH